MMALWGILAAAQADVLLGVNGERFVGIVIEETADQVIFESDLGGRLTVPRAKVKEIQRLPVVTPPDDSQATTNATWKPPGVGRDGYDWLGLDTDEWLKGRLRFLQDKKIEFESDHLEDLTIDLKDVRSIYSGQPMFSQFYTQKEPVFGTVAVEQNAVTVTDKGKVITDMRDNLSGITPGGAREINFWSGKLTLGLNLQEGNSQQTSMNVSGQLARRTPSTEFIVDYLANYSEVDGRQNADNHRINSSFDIRLNRYLFVRAVQFEYYRDPLANIEQRGTVGVGLGYYILDQSGLKWLVSGGPGYQITQYATSTTNENSRAETPAGVAQSYFKVDLTRRLKFIQSFQGIFTERESGLYNHHAVSTLEVELKHFLNLDVSFVWDYQLYPKTESDGVIPKNSDFRINLGLGVKF